MSIRFFWSSLAFAVGLTFGIACDDESTCTPGAEACPCNEGLCLAGLTCLSGYCVDPNWMPPAGDGAVADDGDDGDDGDSSYDNIEACNALVDEVQCGSFDLSTVVDCSIYEMLTCDISDYFDCVREVITCENDVVDVGGVGECAEMASCT